MKSPILNCRRGLVALIVGLVSALVVPRVPAQTSPSGGTVVEGTVRNAATGVQLRAAMVEIPVLGRQALTDDYGRFAFLDLPPGEHTLVTTYTGLQPQRATVVVVAGRKVARDFELTADIYQLEEFRVAGEREGNAAAITRQRNAPNVKNVVSLDAGNLLNENPGDLLATFVPGVMAELNDDGDVTSLSIRGAGSALNTISIDGNPQASTYGFSRGYRMFAISGALFDEIEVTKAPTPDMPADSLGGSVNMKTRSTLGMTEKRRFTFKAATRWAPNLYDTIPARAGHRFAPQLNAAYQELFDAFGGKRNLGVSLNLFYNENVNGTFTVTEDYAATTASPAYVWDYRNFDQFYNRRNRSANVKLEYKLSEHTTVIANLMYNEPSTLFDHRRTMRAFTSQTVAVLGANGQPTGTGAILPGYTDTITQVRNVAASTVQLNSSLFDFLVQERKFEVELRHVRENPTAWREDVYFMEMSRFAGTRDAAENITAAYSSGEAKFGSLGVVAEVRMERTDTESNGFVGSRVRTTTAQRNVNPIGSARADFNNRRHLDGSYTDWFPGVHVRYRGGARWQARASWSNNVGRPALTNYLPLETVNATAQTLTVNNPSLKPQYTDNYDVTIEYYFEPVGVVSLGVFRKNIGNYIVTNVAGVIGPGANNGYDGNYEGFELFSKFNGGWARVDGLEANYQQQLSFLPGVFKGLGVFANYTKLKAEGNYGGTAVQSTGELADFMPESFNAGVSYRYRGFIGRVRTNYSGSFLTDYSTNASRLRYRASRQVVNASLSYQWRNGLQIFCDVFNLFNETQEFYRYVPGRLATKIFPETTITFGVTGKF